MASRFNNVPNIGERTQGFEQPSVGRAYVEGEATVSGVYYDLGFIPEMIYINNLGSQDINVAFKISEADEQPAFPPNGKVHSKVKANSERTYRKRKEELVLLQSVSGVSEFILEAW